MRPFGSRPTARRGDSRRSSHEVRRSVGYTYDTAGNLVSFMDPAERSTEFEYRNAGHPHHLTDITDWRGVRVAAIDYQDEGRLERMCDADGVCQRSAYDLDDREMTITARVKTVVA